MSAFAPETAATAAEDLSPLIITTVERETGDVVRCTRVNRSYYRCNWWSKSSNQPDDNSGMRGGQVGTTHRVRKSQFLDVSKDGDKLLISVLREGQ
jgi:hypothetical protein